jgi:autophagy-related protein 11
LAISQLEHLFQNDAPTLSQGEPEVDIADVDLMELDSAMREDLSVLTSVKVSGYVCGLM